MKKRDMKQYLKEIQKFNTNMMNPKEKKAAGNKQNKVKMPYKMYQGMQNKSIQRMNQQKDMDKNLGIIADTSREKKVMQSHFEIKAKEKQDAKKGNLDRERGVNWHQFSDAKYKNGALMMSKSGIKNIIGEDENQATKKSDKSKKSYDDIMKTRELNPEYMTGKRFRKKKGNVGKKFKGNKKHKKK